MVGRFYHQNRKGNMSAFFGAHCEQSDYTDDGTDPSWLNMLDDPEYRKTKLYGKVMCRLGCDDHRVSFFVHDARHGGDAGRLNRDFQHHYQTVNLAYKNQVSSAVHAKVKLGYRLYDRRWEEDTFPDLSLRSEDSVCQEIFPADAVVNLRHVGGGLLTLGADAQAATYHTFSEPDGVKRGTNDASARALGLYAQEKLVLGDWVLRAGGRYAHTRHEYDTLGGVEPGESSKSWGRSLWSGGARWNAIPSLSLYANADTSFVAPAAKSLGDTLQVSDEGVPGRKGQIPNSGLDPEKGLGLDLGADARVGERLAVGVRGFWHRIDEAIVENVVSTDPSQSRSANAGEATAYGAEVILEGYAAAWLHWFANATYTRTAVKNDLDPDQDGSHIPFVPDHMVNAGFTWHLPWDVTLSPYLRTVGTYYDSTSESGRRAFGGHTVVNLKAAKRFQAPSGYGAVLSLDLLNLTDREVEMPWQFQDPGFQWMATVEVEL